MFIQESTLARFLNVTAPVIRRQASQKGWTIHTIAGSPHYEIAQIDSFLAEVAIGFSSAPTVADLREGKVILKKTTEVAPRLGITAVTVVGHIERGKLASVRIGLQFMVDETAVQRAEAELNTDFLLPRITVAHVLGVGLPTVNAYVKNGQLISVVTTQKRNAITRESVEAFLKPRLSLTTPDAWVEDRLVSKRPLLRASQHAQWADEFDLAQIQHITYSRPASDPHLVLPESALFYLGKREPVLDHKEYLQLFGFENPRATNYLYRMKYPEFFECPLHDHNKDYLRSCILAMLNNRCVGGMTPRHWLSALTEQNDQIVHMSYVRDKLRRSWTTLAKLKKEERLPGLSKPGGEVIFLQSSIDFFATPEGRKALDGAA